MDIKNNNVSYESSISDEWHGLTVRE